MPEARSLRRSLLYVPGSSEAMMEKAATRGADVVILDLEDGVHPAAKDDARERVARAARSLARSIEVWIRVNAAGSAWGDRDVAMVSVVSPSGVVLPKSEGESVVANVAETLAAGPELFLMVETAAGVLNAPSLARASPRIGGLIFGAADFRESTRAPKHADESEITFARNQILLASRAAGVDVFDTPWFDHRDATGLEESALRARALGFDGKTAIHPAQVPVINAAFSPSADEVARAERIVHAMERALEAGKTVATLDGEMVEALHLSGARRILDRAAAVRSRG